MGMTDDEWAAHLGLVTPISQDEALRRIQTVRDTICDDGKADRWFRHIQSGTVNEMAQLTMLLPAWVPWIDWTKVP